MHFIDAKTKLEKVNKLSFISTQLPFDIIYNDLHDAFQVMRNTVAMFGSENGEIGVLGIHKAVAMEYLLNHIGMDHTEVIALGDSHNDIEMLTYAHTGIAMGNANDEVKKAADDITDSLDQDGIYKAFVKYGLVSA